MPYSLPISATVDRSKTGGMGLNLRDAPSTTGRRLGTMPDNSPVAVVGVAREAFDADASALWYQVRYRQLTGYCAASYLALNPDPRLPLPRAAIVDRSKTGGVGLRLRESPARTGRFLTTMRDNSPLQIIGAASEGLAPGAPLWYQVRFGDRRGYCLSDYVVVSSTPGGGVIAPPAGPFVGAWPAGYPERVITAPFDQPRSYGRHEGIDLRAPNGTPIIAWADGRVVMTWSWDGVSLKGNHAYGNHVKLFHPALGLFSMYCHLQSFSVIKDQVLQMGDRIGLADSTGNVKGAHLHFMLIDPVNGLKGYVYPNIIDPTPYLPKPDAVL